MQRPSKTTRGTWRSQRGFRVLGYSYRGSRVIGRACRRLSTPSRGHRMFPTCSFQISLFSPEIGLVSSSDKSLFRVTTRWATGWGRAGRTETWATRISRSGTMPRPSSTTRRTGRLQRIKVGNRAGEGRALGVRAARQGPVAGADQAPGPIVTRRPACLDDRVRQAAKWLQAAFDGGGQFAKLHLAHLTFFAGQEDAELAHLKEHLSWHVQRGRDTCVRCG
jgi:hypothetical protein